MAKDTESNSKSKANLLDEVLKRQDTKDMLAELQGVFDDLHGRFSLKQDEQGRILADSIIDILREVKAHISMLHQRTIVQGIVMALNMQGITDPEEFSEGIIKQATQLINGIKESVPPKKKQSTIVLPNQNQVSQINKRII